MVNLKAFILLFLVLNAFSALAQKEIAKAARLLNEADSVILISHLTTVENHEKLEGIVLPSGIVDDTQPIFPSFFAGRHINQAIIVQRKLLPKQDVLALANIIQKPVKKSHIGTISLCFEPHHAVLFYKNGRFSFMEICFKCSNLITSSNLKLSNMDFMDGKWKAMKEFFLKQGLTYELRGNNYDTNLVNED